MKSADEILSDVDAILSTDWAKRDGRQVPSADDVQLGNDAVHIDGTVLYADMRDSTGLVDGYKDWFAAEVYKSYLVACCHTITRNDGAITAFDGDRVMAVFFGSSKNSNAGKAALQINYIVREVNSRIRKRYSNTSFELKHAVGIDTSPLFVAKTGIRNHNDLVWVGKAANYAAKFAQGGDEGYPTIISEAVFEKLNQESKNGGSPKRCMWERRTWGPKLLPVYRSSWWWPF